MKALRSNSAHPVPPGTSLRVVDSTGFVRLAAAEDFCRFGFWKEGAKLQHERLVNELSSWA